MSAGTPTVAQAIAQERARRWRSAYCGNASTRDGAALWSATLGDPGKPASRT
jgi:hypothetical protein